MEGAAHLSPDPEEQRATSGVQVSVRRQEADTANSFRFAPWNSRAQSTEDACEYKPSDIKADSFVPDRRFDYEDD